MKFDGKAAAKRKKKKQMGKEYTKKHDGLNDL